MHVPLHLFIGKAFTPAPLLLYTMQSKINSELLEACVRDILTFSKGGKVTIVKKGKSTEKQGKVRKFLETVELQATLKNYDPKKMKRFSGSYQLPVAPKPGMKICVLANETHMQAAKKINCPYMTVDDLKKLNKDKKLIKKLGTTTAIKSTLLMYI